jgi:hypothetical protein
MSIVTPSARRGASGDAWLMRPRVTSQRTAAVAQVAWHGIRSRSAPPFAAASARACSATRARSSGWAQRRIQSPRRSGPCAGSSPNSSNMRRFQSGRLSSTVRRPQADARRLGRRFQPVRQRLRLAEPSTRSVSSSSTPTKAAAGPRHRAAGCGAQHVDPAAAGRR